MLVEPQVVEVIDPNRCELQDLDGHGRLDEELGLLA
jgi:hypothetical protein